MTQTFIELDPSGGLIPANLVTNGLADGIERIVLSTSFFGCSTIDSQAVCFYTSIVQLNYLLSLRRPPSCVHVEALH